MNIKKNLIGAAGEHRGAVVGGLSLAAIVAAGAVAVTTRHHRLERSKNQTRPTEHDVPLIERIRIFDPEENGELPVGLLRLAARLHISAKASYDMGVRATGSLLEEGDDETIDMLARTLIENNFAAEMKSGEAVIGWEKLPDLDEAARQSVPLQWEISQLLLSGNEGSYPE